MIWPRRRALDRPLDFVILGAEKAGTTFFSSWLRDAPAVHMPESEVRYFRDPFFGPPAKLADDVGDPGDAELVGIKHPSYLAYREVPQRLADHNPDMRFLVSLRDPVDRIVSAYFHYLRSGQIPPLPPEEGLARVLDDPDASPKYRDIATFGHYHEHLTRFARLFARDRFLVLEYERLVADQAAAESVFAFLGVPAHPVQLGRRVNAGTYDWTACVLEHYRNAVSRRFDERMNVVGRRGKRRRETYRASDVGRLLDEVRATLAVGPAPSEISEGLRERLVDHHRDDVARLVEDGWLVPRAWAHYPAG